jgi:hypothetical protein
MFKRLEIISSLLVFGVVLLALASNVHAATCNNTGGGQWTNPAGWDCGFVPNPTDDVNITGGLQVVIGVGDSIVRQGATNILPGQSLSQNGTLTNYGTFTIDGGASNNAGSGTIINYGTMIFVSGMGNSGTIINCGTMTGMIPGGVQPCPSTPPAPSLPQTPLTCANDGRINSICTDPGATAVLYCQANGDLHVYGVDSESRGYLALIVTPQHIEDAGVPEGSNAILVAASEDSIFRVYRLADGSFQLNAPTNDAINGYIRDGYIFNWQGNC